MSGSLKPSNYAATIPTVSPVNNYRYQDMLVYGTSAFDKLNIGSNGQVLSVNGGLVEWTTPAGVGEVNVGANVGTGTGILYHSKAGPTLNFKTIKAGNGINVANNASDVTLSINNLALTSVNVVADNTERDSLTVEAGDIAKVTSTNKSFVYDGSTWIELTDGTGVTDHTSLTSIGTNTHAQIDTHIADSTKHRQINDSAISATSLYSSQKIENNERTLVRNVINNTLLVNSNLPIVDDNFSYYFLKTSTLLPAGWHLKTFPITGYTQGNQPFASTNDASVIGGYDIGSVDNYLYMWCDSNPLAFKSILLRMVVNCSHLVNFYVNEFDTQLSFDDSEARPYFVRNILSPSVFLPAIITENVSNRIAVLISKSNDGLRLYGSLSLFGMSSNAVGELRDVEFTNLQLADLLAYSTITEKWVNSPLVIQNGAGGDQNLLSQSALTVTSKSLKAGTNINFTGSGAGQVTINSTSGSTDLNGLSDVVISSPAYGNNLRWDGIDKWENYSYSITAQGSVGSLSIIKDHQYDTILYSLKAGTNMTLTQSGDDIVFASTGGGATNLDALTDVDLTTPPVLGSCLSYTTFGNKWIPVSISAVNLGSGQALLSAEVFGIKSKSLVAGAGITMSSNTNELTISASGASENINDRILIDNTRGQSVSVGKVLGTTNGNGAAGQLQVDKRGVLWACQAGNTNNTIYKWVPTDMINSPYTYTHSQIASTISTGFTGGYTSYNAVSDKFFARYFNNVIQVVDCLTSTPSTYTLQNANTTAGMVSIGKYLYLMPWASTKVTRIDTLAMTETVYTGIPNVTSLRPCVINGYIYSYNYFGTGILKFDIAAGTAVSISHGGSEQMGYLSAPVGRYIYSDVTEGGTRVIMKFDTETDTFKRITFPYQASDYGWVSGAVSDNGYIIYSTSSYNASQRFCVLNTLNDTFAYNETNAYNTIASHAYNPFNRSFMIQGSDNILRFYSCGADGREFGEISNLNNRLPSDRVLLGGTRYIQNEGGGNEDVAIKTNTDNGHLFAVRTTSASGHSGFNKDKIFSAFQLPVLDSVIRDSLTNLQPGLIFYNATTSTVQFFNGSSWGNI